LVLFAITWEQRKINEIFDAISSGNRLPKDNLIEGKIPYVIAMVSNNGIYKHISSNTSDFHGNKMKLFQSPSITFSIDNPEAIFVQNKPFYTSNIMRFLHNIDLDEEAYLFIALQMKKLTKHFDWSLKFSGPVVSNLNISFPIFNGEINFKEVKRIGGLIREIDNLITLHQRKYDKLVNTKKALLDKMFPKNGELVPKLRFRGFTDAWEQYKLGGLGFFKSNGVDKLSKPNEIPVNLLNYMDVYSRRKVSNKNAHELMQVTAKPSQLIENSVMKNDVFFTPTSETPEDIGRVYVIEETLNNTVYSYHLMRFRPNQGTYYPNFPNYSLMTGNVRKQFFLAAKGVQRYVISKADFESIIDTIPEYREQAKIGEFFRSIDSLITLHQRKLINK